MEHFPYKDAVLEATRLAEEAGIQPSAVDELRERVSREVAEGKWKNVRGEIVNVDTKMSAEEFIGSLQNTHPHYWLSDNAQDAAELAFGDKPTLKARGEFIKAFGQANYDLTKKQWGCDDGLRPGTKPGPTHDAAGKKIPPPAGSSSNPWNAKLFNGTEDQRQAKMASIIKTGTKFAEDMAKAAGVTITGAPLRR